MVNREKPGFQHYSLNCQSWWLFAKSINEFITCFHEFSDYETTIFFHQYVCLKTNSLLIKNDFFFLFWAFEKIKINFGYCLVEKNVISYLENSWKHVVSLTFKLEKVFVSTIRSLLYDNLTSSSFLCTFLCSKFLGRWSRLFDSKLRYWSSPRLKIKKRNVMTFANTGGPRLVQFHLRGVYLCLIFEMSIWEFIIQTWKRSISKQTQFFV